MTASTNDKQAPTDLEQVVQRLSESPHDGGKITLGEVLDTIGRRSFAPILLLCGLIMAAPVVGDIPGVPVVLGAVVVLLGLQMLFHKEHLWLPQFLLKRSVKPEKLDKTVSWLRRPARFVDRFLRPRLRLFTQGPAVYVIALVCVLIAALTPLMEVVPMSANVAGIALTAFGLALIADDGLLALAAFLCTAAVVGLVVYNLM